MGHRYLKISEQVFYFSYLQTTFMFHISYSQLPSMTRKRKRAHDGIRDQDQGEDTTSKILAMRAERNVQRNHEAEDLDIYQV